MSGVNKVILIGRLGRDPETKYVGETTVCNFSIATSEKWKDKNSGQSQEKTEWHRIVCWRRLAEICSQYLSKGSQVYIEGKLQTRSWEQDGSTRYTTEIVANSVQFLGGSSNRGGSVDRGDGMKNGWLEGEAGWTLRGDRKGGSDLMYSPDDNDVPSF